MSVGLSLFSESRKQIAFDLSQEELKEHYGKNHINSYRDLRDFFKKNNWEHSQGSVYVSREPTSYEDMQYLLEEAVKKMPWLEKCAKSIDVTEIGAQHSLKEVLREVSEEVYGLPPNQDNPDVLEI